MKITYDKQADAAYVYLTSSFLPRATRTYPCDPQQVNGMINLDFDAEGRLIGIEIMDASKKLCKDTLKEATGL